MLYLSPEGVVALSMDTEFMFCTRKSTKYNDVPISLTTARCKAVSPQSCNPKEWYTYSKPVKYFVCHYKSLHLVVDYFYT